MKDDSPFVFVGLWEGWQNPATQEWLRTYMNYHRPTSSDGPFVKVVTTQMRRHLLLACSSVVIKSKVSSGLVAELVLQIAEKCVKHLLRCRVHESRTHCRDQPADLTF